MGWLFRELYGFLRTESTPHLSSHLLKACPSRSPSRLVWLQILRLFPAENICFSVSWSTLGPTQHGSWAPGYHSWSTTFFWTVNFLLSSWDCISQLQRPLQDMSSWGMLVAAAGRDSPMDISWGELMLVIKAVTDLWGLCVFHLFNLIFIMHISSTFWNVLQTL